jgi:hypothetical protein
MAAAKNAAGLIEEPVLRAMAVSQLLGSDEVLESVVVPQFGLASVSRSGKTFHCCEQVVVACDADLYKCEETRHLLGLRTGERREMHCEPLLGIRPRLLASAAWRIRNCPVGSQIVRFVAGEGSFRSAATLLCIRRFSNYLWLASHGHSAQRPRGAAR